MIQLPSSARPRSVQTCFGSCAARFLGCILLLQNLDSSAATTNWLLYAPAPPDNPLKGFVTYPRPRSEFPHSLVWNYLSLRSLMSGPTNFTWEPLEAELNSAASQGRQFIPRFHMDFPGKPIAIPQFLMDAGVLVRTWTNTNTQPWPAQVAYTVDYEDSRVRAALSSFIHALGRKFDGDPRLAYVPMGLIGTWGEWHNSPRDEWFASKETQRIVMDAYEAAFKTTPVLARYPAGDKDSVYVGNTTRRFGYHDDSFAWATMETGRRQDAWFFCSRLAGAGATGKWREYPIGGEVRPEVWNCLWDLPSCAPAGQEFLRCATNTHVSWLANQGVFGKKLEGGQLERALVGARILGYEFHIPKVVFGGAIQGFPLSMAVTVTNCGLAPFYYAWPVELGAVDAQGKLAQTWSTSFRLTGILPGAPSTLWQCELPALTLVEGRYHLVLRVVHPLANGIPLRFANTTQGQHLTGWLSLGSLDVGPHQR
jgi:hypothetical protein